MYSGGGVVGISGGVEKCGSTCSSGFIVVYCGCGGVDLCCIVVVVWLCSGPYR